MDSDINNFSEKHGSGVQADPKLTAEIVRRAKDNQLPCAVAFKIAKDLEVSPSEIGRAADLQNLRLIKCQLGLFGYKPEKKIVKPLKTENKELVTAIKEALVNDRLPCERAWDIAERFGESKLTVSNICEGMGLKVKPCQLGAF